MIDRGTPRLQLRCCGKLARLLVLLALAPATACQIFPLGGTDTPPVQSISSPHAAKKSRPAEAHRSRRPVGSNLVGLDEGEVTALLGSPASRENLGTGQRWVYRTGKCTLTMALYPDIQTRTLRSLSYEVERDDHTERGRRLCEGELGHGSANASADAHRKN